MKRKKGIGKRTGIFRGLAIAGVILGLVLFGARLFSGGGGEGEKGERITGAEILGIQGGGESCAYNITSCNSTGWVAGAVNCLNASMNASGDCMIIDAANVIFDCWGYNITGNGSGMGISAQHLNNITIKNCNINNFSWGIFFIQNVSNSLINNSNFTAAVSGENDCIKLGGTTVNNTVTNNIINTTGNSQNGIGVGGEGTTGNLIESNQIYTYGNDSARGVFINYNAYGNTIRNNTITTYGQEGAGAPWGIDLQSAANHNKIQNNTLRVMNTAAIDVEDVSNTTISGNIFLNYSGYEIRLETTSNKSLIYENNLTSTDTVLDQGTDNNWNASTGNHWSSYDQIGEGCYDCDSNNICDDAYLITTGVYDYLPDFVVDNVENVSFSFNSSSQKVKPRVNATYNLEIHNLGNKTENFTLTINNYNNVETAALNQSNLTNLGGRGCGINITLTVGENRTGTHYISVTANDSDNSLSKTSSNVTTKVGFLIEDTIWEANLTAVSYSTVVFGDLNKDGWEDMVLTGIQSDLTTSLTKIYLNNGSSLIENTTWESNLTAVYEGEAGLGDIDNDNDLDLILSGCANEVCDADDVGVYLNNGSGLMRSDNWGANLSAMVLSSIALGDLNSDGRIDMVLGKDVYINNGTALYLEANWNANISSGITAVQVALGDLDNDEDLDLILTGQEGATLLSKVYLNNGSGLVENTGWESNLTAVGNNSIVIGDIDKEGDLDLILTGNQGANIYSKVYLNNGTGLAENITWESNLTGIQQGAMALGDVNNDGKLDLVLIGNRGNCDTIAGDCYAGVYINNGSGFSANESYNYDLAGVYHPSVAFNDLDKDGKLDLTLTGTTVIPVGTTYTKVYTSAFYTANTAPRAPNTLAATDLGDTMRLSWSEGNDAETGSTGLYYNVRAGTTSGGNNTISGKYGGAANPTAGYFGNAMQRRSIVLNLTGEETFYWCVQTIDVGLMVSNCSAENTYSPPTESSGSSKTPSTPPAPPAPPPAPPAPPPAPPAPPPAPPAPAPAPPEINVPAPPPSEPGEEGEGEAGEGSVRTVSLDVVFENKGKEDIMIEQPRLIEETKEKLAEEDKFEEKLKGKGLKEEEIKERLELERLKEAENLMPVITTKFFSLWAALLSGMVPSEESVSGKLLKTEIINPEEMVLKPGEKIEKTLEVRQGISTKARKVRMMFKSSTGDIIEKEIEISQARIGTAVDVDRQKNLIDIYMVIPPGEGSSEEKEDYRLELNINKKGEEKKGGITGWAVGELVYGEKTRFSELYGPYKVKKKEGMVFAQQLKYDPTAYYGKHLVKTKVLEGKKTATENEFEIDLGEQKAGEKAWAVAGKAIIQKGEEKAGVVWAGIILLMVILAGLLSYVLRKQIGRVIKALGIGLGIIFAPLAKGLDELYSSLVGLRLRIKASREAGREKKEEEETLRRKEERKAEKDALRRFMENSLRQGYGREEIKAKLVEKGWPEEKVEEELEKEIKEFGEIWKKEEKEGVREEIQAMKEERAKREKKKSLGEELNYVEEELRKLKEESWKGGGEWVRVKKPKEEKIKQVKFRFKENKEEKKWGEELKKKQKEVEKEIKLTEKDGGYLWQKAYGKEEAGKKKEGQFKPVEEIVREEKETGEGKERKAENKEVKESRWEKKLKKELNRVEEELERLKFG